MAITGSNYLILVGIFTVAHLANQYRKKRLLNLPPGLQPKWPFIGNAFDMPTTYVHVFYKELGKKLGTKMIYMEAFGRPILVINDLTIAQDLLDKRSSIYSSRPELPMLRQVVGYTSFFVMEPYGEGWKVHRKMFTQYFSDSSNLSRFREKEYDFIRKGLLPNLLEHPKQYAEHCRNTVGGLSTSLTYGLPVQRRNDPLIKMTEQSVRDGAYMTAPGKYLVNIFPELRHIPDWMPGADFKRVAKEVRGRLDHNMNHHWDLALEAINAGTAQECFVTQTLERICDKPDYDTHAYTAKEVAVQVFGALSETTISSILTFILAMVLYPDVQRRLQAEIDSAVGSDRLVEFSDIERMRYLSAVVKETLRWNTPLPMAVPHFTTQADEYNGYHIPKDCTVFANTHAIFHDEDVFPEPDKFNPDRFLTPDGSLRKDLPDSEAVGAFGYGRRVCPGKDIAVTTLYLTIASVLHLFDIGHALDENGIPVPVEAKFLPDSIGSDPLPFLCDITPRKGKDVEALLHDYIGSDPI